MKHSFNSILMTITLVVGFSSQVNAEDSHPIHCQSVTESKIASLFDRRNNSLQTGNPLKVVANYAE